MDDFSPDDFVPDAPVNQAKAPATGSVNQSTTAQAAFSPHDFTPDAAPPPSFSDQVGHALGSAGRDLTQGYANPFTGASDLLAKYGNFVTSDFNRRYGTNIPKIPDNATGTFHQLLTDAGEPESQGAIEKATEEATPYIMNAAQALPAIKEAATNAGDMIANTSLGKKLAQEEPTFVEASLSRAQDWANRLSEDVMGKMRAEMKKKGHNL